jgi:hypothetical protein
MAEWGVRGGTVGTEHHGYDLQEFVGEIAEDVRLTYGRGVRLEWLFEFGGDRSPGETEALVTASGVTLPTSS